MTATATATAAAAAAAVAAAAAATTGFAAQSRRKIMVVIGTTAVGKTRLGIELAERLGGEIVNCDAMQMYAGLDIATAKPTAKEQARVPHHLFGHLPTSASVNVLDYRLAADKAIDDICSRGRLPIIVGGTMYYVQSLLYDTVMDGLEPAASSANVECEGAWEDLEKVDPEMAKKLHPSDTRKIRRSLEIFQRTGKRHSQLIIEQHERGGGVGGTKRYDSAIFWLHAERDVLDERIDSRVDKMLEQGLMKEIDEMQDQLGGSEGDSRGLLQSIGFKEWTEYLNLQGASSNGSDIDGAELQAAIDAGTDRLKQRTRRYARKQLTWIRNRMVRRGVLVHLLDATHAEKWDDIVLNPAIEIANAFLKGESPKVAKDAHSAALRIVESAEALKKKKAEKETSSIIVQL